MPQSPELLPVPWLTPAAQALVGRIRTSHHSAYGRPLLAGLPADASPLQWAQALFSAAVVVLAHDDAHPAADPGPRLIYANRAALSLWRRPWSQLVGMPSRLTAEPGERAGRARDLAGVRRQRAIADYGGIRVDSQGRRFHIAGARVWTLPSPGGQAAAFNSWWWL
jgi:hypothetical protein